jgi:GNAT superfamily N-acetyltransferase
VTSAVAQVTVAPLEEGDVAEADAVFRLAFGTALGLPEPARFAEGAELVRTRRLAHPDGAFAAKAEGDVVGCAFVTRLGSCAVMGPLAVRPDFWDRGVGRLLWETRMPLLDRWGIEHAALFTRTEPKNIHLYQSFGFWPGALTALTAKQVDGGSANGAVPAGEMSLDDCRAVTDALHPGLDLEREIRSVEDRGLGGTVGVDGGFAVCHVGEGSEAGPGSCYAKFAAVSPGTDAPARFARLLGAVEGYASAHGARRLVAGVNTARREAYRALLERGYRPFAYGVAMHRPDEPAYDRSDAWVVDDRR